MFQCHKYRLNTSFLGKSYFPRWKSLKQNNIARVFATTGRDSQISNNIWKFKFFIRFLSSAKKEANFDGCRFNQGSFLCRVSNFLKEETKKSTMFPTIHIFIEYMSSMMCWCYRISIWLKRIYNEIKSRRDAPEICLIIIIIIIRYKERYWKCWWTDCQRL